MFPKYHVKLKSYNSMGDPKVKFFYSVFSAPMISCVAAENVGASMFRAIVDDHEEIGTRFFL